MKSSTVTSILIEGPNNSTINIASSFKYETDVQAKVDYIKMIKLPIDLYPPNWENRKITQDAITKAARDQATSWALVRKEKQHGKTSISLT